MNTVLLEALLIASSGLFAIGSMTITILLLISDKGLKNGLSYALGYISGYTLIGLILLLFQYQSTGNGSSNESNPLLYSIILILGLLLILLGIRNYRKPNVGENKENRIFAIVDKINPIKAFGFGFVVTVINFKNLALFLSAMSIVIVSNLSLFDKIMITFAVVFVFCISVIFPVMIYLITPNNGRNILNEIKTKLNNHSHQISIYIPLLFGTIFIIRGVIEFL